MDDGFVVPQPSVAQARDDLDRVGQAYLVNVRLAIRAGVPADELREDIAARANAAKQIVELLG